jgi:ribosomal 30S subunit maturation factor RimM
MIRHDGYYAFEPTLFQERKEFSPDYLTKAYLFQDNGFVTMVSKWSKNKNNISFLKKEFDVKNNSEQFKINNKELYILSYERQPWEEKFYYDRISDEEFVNRQTGKPIKFIPWE